MELRLGDVTFRTGKKGKDSRSAKWGCHTVLQSKNSSIDTLVAVVYTGDDVEIGKIEVLLNSVSLGEQVDMWYPLDSGMGSLNLRLTLRMQKVFALSLSLSLSIYIYIYISFSLLSSHLNCVKFDFSILALSFSR